MEKKVAFILNTVAHPTCIAIVQQKSLSVTNISAKLNVGILLAISTLYSLIGFTGDLSVGTPIAWPFLLGFLAFAPGSIVLGTYLARFIPDAQRKPALNRSTLGVSSLIIARELLSYHR